MVAYTTTYNLKKPTVADDEDVWGGYLNDSMDIIDDVLDGTVPVTGIDINSGTLDNVVIGGTTANTGTFTVLSATTSLGVTGNITVSGTVDGVDIAARDAVLTSTTTTANAALPKAGGTMTGAITFAAGQTFDGRDVSADGAKLDGIESGATADQTKADIDALGIAASTAATLATARNIALTGAVTGNVNFDGSGNVSITTTATSDPTLTLSGDASGSATFTNLGNATLTVTVADDSHNHVISNIDGLQTALDGKLGSTAKAADSNLLDGIDSSAFLRSNANDTMTGVLTVDNELAITAPSATTHFNYQNGGTNYIRGTTQMDGTFNLNGNILDNVEDIYLRDKLFHDDDTDTYLAFGTNTITLATGGSSEITVNTTGVRLGDSGNGYFQPVSGNYGSVQIDGGAHTGWEGYSIGGRAVFMHDNGTGTGIYNDVDNEWLFYAIHNGETRLYYNGSDKLNTLSNGVSINGNLYVDNSVAEDWDSLSGTTPTCNVDAAGAFSLTMTGNTTFTFSGADNNWSQGFILQLTGNGSTVTWPTSVDWAGGTAPDAPASGETDIYVFWTRDGGTTWYGVQSIDAAA